MLAWLNGVLGGLARVADRSTGTRTALASVVVVVGVSVALAPFIDLHPSVLLLDGVTPLGLDDTIYSGGYTDRGFLRVSVGDDRAAVRATLGAAGDSVQVPHAHSPLRAGLKGLEVPVQ